MVDKGLHIPKEDLSGRLQNLMFLRVLFVSLLLGASLFIQAKETKIYFGDIQASHYLIIVSIYFLTFIYIIFLKKAKDLTKLAYVQLLVDTFFVTAIIYSTGGINSIFSFLYILTIINASIILYRKGGMTNIDWPELARPDQTLVVYMGLVGLAPFTANLVANGMAPDTPVAVVSRATLPDQMVVTGTVGEIADLVASRNVPGPTTTIISCMSAGSMECLLRNFSSRSRTCR